MSKSESHRRKRLGIDSAYPVRKYELIAALRKLPEDVALLGVGHDVHLNVYYLVLTSLEFDEVPLGNVVPYLAAPIMTRDDLTASQVPSREEIMRDMPEDSVDLAALLAYGRRGRMTGSQPQAQTLPRECRCDLKYNGGHFPNCPTKTARKA